MRVPVVLIFIVVSIALCILIMFGISLVLERYQRDDLPPSLLDIKERHEQVVAQRRNVERRMLAAERLIDDLREFTWLNRDLAPDLATIILDEIRKFQNADPGEDDGGGSGISAVVPIR